MEDAVQNALQRARAGDRDGFVEAFRDLSTEDRDKLADRILSNAKVDETLRKKWRGLLAAMMAETEQIAAELKHAQQRAGEDERTS